MIDLSSAHLHLALNHIPIIGIAVASFPILIGMIAPCRTTLATGLIATILCAAAMPTIMETGHQAAHDFREGVITPALDEAGKTALHLHAVRARATTPIIYATAILSLLTLLLLIKFPRQATWIACAVLLGNSVSIGFSIWTADAGGHIRHTEFRAKQPPEAVPESAPTNIDSTNATNNTPLI